ncbi:CVNH domain-containing protein [Mycena epipterygia]|nr:CVNH domain-containing protein [Mycena epipterygia]
MNTLLSSVVLDLCALAAVPGALAAPVNGPVPDTDFSSSCTNISFNSGDLVLSATCRNNSGCTDSTSISLNAILRQLSIVVHLQIRVVSTGNGFSSSCEDVPFSGPVTLSALCKDTAGNFVSTSLDLDDALSNINGVLTCGA